MKKTIFSNLYRTYIFSFFLATSLFLHGVGQAEESRVEFSGFARAVVGQLDEENLDFLGYDDGYSFSEQSLLALRADFALSESFSIVAQAIGHTSDARDSGIQWLYLDYAPTQNLSFKLGRQRIPLFNYSDVIDVGFAYSWITPPTQVYTTYIFSEFDGILSRYEFTTKSVSGSVGAYLGQFDGDIQIVGVEQDTKVDYVGGVFASVNLDNFTFSAAYHKGKVEADILQLDAFEDLLRMFNFNSSADELSIDDKASFFKIGLTYNSLDFFVESEFTKIKANSSFVPAVDASYLMAGYNFSPFSVHATVAQSKVHYQAPVNEIPLGVNPQLDALHYGFNQIFASLPIDNLKSLTLGTRYDWKHNIAFKAEVTVLKGDDNERSFFIVTDTSLPEREATLFQLAAEWVF
ncbi:MAG: hypothetical protein ACI9O6_002807 [Glaciecola sp.]|jgi:hypothetical protein